jgi:hypothetical protein
MSILQVLRTTTIRTTLMAFPQIEEISLIKNIFLNKVFLSKEMRKYI